MNWRITQIGEGQVAQSDSEIRLTVPATTAERYHDAQISDYAARRDFRWHPPARMSLTAWVESDGQNRDVPLRGTAGFGFWNHPFVPGERGLRLPAAAWFFFGSTPNNMQLAYGMPGNGWKAATIDARRAAFYALAPTAPIAIFLMRIPALYHRLWPLGQRAIGVSEKALDPALLLERHTYTLAWLKNGVTFSIDGGVVHQAPTAPRGPLGFIAWVDNQYAVVTPQGRFGFGLVDVPHAQTLVIENIELTAL